MAVMAALAAGVLVAWLATAWLAGPVSRMLAHGGAGRPNYRGREVPTAGGLAVLLGLTLGSLPWLLAGRAGAVPAAALVAWWGMGLLGLLDDLAGDRQARGFRGHWRALAGGRLTTGFLKASGGLLVSAIAAAVAAGGWEALGRGIVAALAANAVNLLDVRPGRAAKGYLAGTMLLLPVAGGDALFLLLLPAAAAAGFLPRELREEAMLGDAGSNPLGASLGLAAGLALPPSALFLAGASLLALNLYAERHSLSEFILRHPWLDHLDRLGRLE